MHVSFQGLKDFMVACSRGYFLKADTFCVATYTPVKGAEPLTEEWVDQYLQQELQMQRDSVRKKGYISIFLMQQDGSSVMHVRCFLELGEWVASYLD